MMKDRPHQAGVRDCIRKQRKARKKQHEIVLNVVPGGGKSACAPIMYHEMMKDGGTAPSRVIWVVPRLLLQGQAAGAFDGKWCDSRPLASRISEFISRQHVGFATNYMKLGCSLEEHINLVQPGTMLVIDEGHHCSGTIHPETGAIAPLNQWAKAINELSQEVRKTGGHVMTMTGTAWRSSGEAIFGLPYRHRGRFNRSKNPLFWVDQQMDSYVEMLRKDGLDCNAIVPVDFHLIDGSVSWTSGEQSYGPYTLSEMTVDQPVAGAVRAFVHTASSLHTTVQAVVDRALHDRQQAKRPGQVLIVAKSCMDAKRITEDVERRYPRLKTAMAVSRNEEEGEDGDGYSDFSEEAKANVNTFCDGDIDVLVTVAMAYEGMDAPGCDRLVHLGTYRSESWMMQCLARVWRHGGWKKKCHVYAPHDLRMLGVIDAIRTVNPETGDPQDEARFFSAAGRYPKSVLTEAQQAETEAAARRFAVEYGESIAATADVMSRGGGGGAPSRAKSGGRDFFADPAVLGGWTPILGV
jgi:hypothetical protein